MGLHIPTAFTDSLMTGEAEGTVAVRLLEKSSSPGVMQLVTTDTVAVGKGPMQTEPAPFIRFPFMAAETEPRLRGNKKCNIGRVVWPVTGITGPALCRGMRAGRRIEDCSLMATCAQGFLLPSEQELLV